MCAVPKIEKFNLFRLPYVAVLEVLSTWSPYELINLSMISLKSKKLVKSTAKRSKYTVSLGIAYQPQVTIRGTEEFSYEITSRESEDKKFEGGFKEPVLQKYSEDVIQGFKNWSEYVLEVFDSKVNKVTYWVNQFPVENESIIDWLKLQSNIIETFRIFEYEEEEEENEEMDKVVSYIFKNFDTIKKLELSVTLSQNFNEKLPKNLNCLIIDSASLDHLLTLDSKRLKIQSSFLSNQDLSRFITSWMSLESNLRLESFETFIKNGESMEQILRGLPQEKVIRRLPELEIIKQYVSDKFNIEALMSNGCQIIRNDGRTALLYHSKESRIPLQFFLVAQP